METTKRLTFLTLAIFTSALGGMVFNRLVLHSQPEIDQTPSYLVFGDQDAKVEIFLFEDLMCSACRWFIEKVIPSIRESYLNLGIAKLVVIPLILHDESRMLANAALEIYHQDSHKFFVFLHELFSQFPEQDPSFEDLVGIAEEIGDISLEQFTQNVQFGRYDKDLDANFEFAKTMMRKTVRTPAVFINRTPVHGLTFTEISAQIDRMTFDNGAVH